MGATATESSAPSLARAWSARGRWPVGTLVGALVAAALVLLPLIFLVVEAVHPGLDEARRLLLRHTVAVLLWNTARLAVACTLLCAAVGVAAAWCVERTSLPARRLWAVLLVLPLGIPDFVIGFGWVSIAPGLRGYPAAVMIMTLSLYPLVYLPVASALRHLDGSLEEAARSLGVGPWRTFTRVTLRQIRPALLGGCLLVALALLAEYGAFEIVEYRTFTVAIFTAVQARLRHRRGVRAVAGPGGHQRRRARGRARPQRAGGRAPQHPRLARAGAAGAPGPAHRAAARRPGGRGGARPRGSRRGARLLADTGRLEHAARDLGGRGDRPHRRLQRRGGRTGHGTGAAGGDARRTPPQPLHGAAGAAQLPADGAARRRGRTRASCRSRSTTPSRCTRARWS